MKYLKTLNEIRNQGELPFDGGDPIKDKPLHIHLKDAMEYLDSKNNINPNSITTNNKDLDYYYKEYLDKAVNIFMNTVDEQSEVSASTFIDDYGDNTDIFKYKPNSLEDFSDYITKKGSELFKKHSKDWFEENLLEFNPSDNIEQNDKGLIRIWRGITLEKSDSMKDVYEEILGYNGVGIFWSWDKSMAYPHLSKSSREQFFIFSGWVRPEDVNWTRTIYKGGYGLREEKEIEVKGGVSVIIDSLYKYENRKRIKFDDTKYVVRT